MTAITTFLPTIVPHKATAGLAGQKPRRLCGRRCGLFSSSGLSLNCCCTIAMRIPHEVSAGAFRPGKRPCGVSPNNGQTTRPEIVRANNSIKLYAATRQIRSRPDRTAHPGMIFWPKYGHNGTAWRWPAARSSSAVMNMQKGTGSPSCPCLPVKLRCGTDLPRRKLSGYLWPPCGTVATKP